SCSSAAWGMTVWPQNRAYSLRDPPQTERRNTMRYSATAFGIAIGVAFTAGLVVSPLTRFAPEDAHSQTATALTPAMIELAGMKHGDIPTTALPEMNSKMLVVTDNATVGIQSGNVGKHMHPKTDEIQYII